VPSIVAGSRIFTFTDSILYCPRPLTNYREVCVTVGGELLANSSAGAMNTTLATIPINSDTAATTSLGATTAGATTTTAGAPQKAAAAGRVGGAIGGAIGGAMAIGVVALWML